ncbi:MAG: MFS transporter [Anaerolineales bacterium]|nr:MFS transporter [Anaerolineales bacterium]
MDLTPPLEAQRAPIITRTFYTLKYRDFRLYWFATFVSLLGVSFQTLAQGWLVYRLTDSPLMLGLVGFIAGVFAAPLWLVGGVIADRFPRRRLLIITQTLSIFPPLIMAVLIWTDAVQVWHVILMTAVIAVIAAVDIPARFAIIPNLVPEEDLGNAQALSSLARQVTRIIGPALAGIVIAVAGEALCFALNGLSYGALVIAFSAMHTRSIPTAKKESVRKSLSEGVRYTLYTPVVLGLLGLVLIQGLFLSSHITLLPVYARDILGIGSTGLGYMTSALGVGAIIGALAVGNLAPGKRGRFLLIASLCMPFVLVIYAWSRYVPISLLMLGLLGAGTVVLTTTSITLFLLTLPDEFRGRVSSLGAMLFFGAPMVGALVIGYVAEQRGSVIALAIAAGLFLIFDVILFWRVRDLRKLK